VEPVHDGAGDESSVGVTQFPVPQSNTNGARRKRRKR
jgi:hypothetical protein